MLLPAITARPLKTPLPLLDTFSNVDIYHPGVSQGPPILQFRSFPSEPDSSLVGVPLGVVLDACFIIAGNQRGELQLYAAPHERVAGADSDPDGLLVPGMYHFVVVREGVLDYNYHLCGSFSAWTPPVEIPTRWLGGEAARAPPPPNISDISAAVKSADKVCIMTGAATSLQASHLVPKAEADWFRFHYRVLTGYGGNPEQDLNSVRNEVALRADLSAQGFDQGLFVFVPYAEHVVAVFVRNLAQDLAHEYHLRAIDFPTRIRRGYLFIRFAWNIFKFLTPGLADAAVVIRPLKERPDGGGFLKRTHADTTSGGSKKPKTGGTKQEDVGGADNTPITEDEDEAQLVVFDKLDASLKARALTVEDVEVGRYPGFSAIKRLEHKYLANPQISAVSNTLVWEEGDDD